MIVEMFDRTGKLPLETGGSRREGKGWGGGCRGGEGG